MTPDAPLPASPAPTLLLWVPEAHLKRLDLLDEWLPATGTWQAVHVFAPVRVTEPGGRWAHPNLCFHPPVTGLQEALRLVDPSDDNDVAWWALGTDAPPGWAVELQIALRQHSSLGTCSPVCIGDPLHTPLNDHDIGSADVGWVTHWLMAHAAAETVELGLPLAHAGVMRGAVARALARATSGGDWPQTVCRLGWSHATSARVCVSVGQGQTTECFGECLDAQWGLLADGQLWRHAHPLTGLRHALSDALVQHTLGSRTAMPTMGQAAASTRLHIMHGWGGGLAKWVGDFCAAEVQQGQGRALILKSVGIYGAFGQRLELHLDHHQGPPIEYWELGVPIHATAIVHLQVQRILHEIIQRYGVTDILVSSLIGHSLDVLRTGLPTILIAHDHYPFCVALYSHFQTECRQCDGDRLRRCINSNPEHRFFKGVHAEDWSALREAFTRTVESYQPFLVAPCESAAKRWQSHMPNLGRHRFHVIEHGVDLPPALPFDPPEDGRLRVVILGRLSAEKGRGHLLSMMPEMSQFCDVLLLGCGQDADEFKSWSHITVQDHFNREDLPHRLAGWRPHLGLLLSNVPETFSYTLSELWHSRIPVLACAIGALADRIEEGQTGFLEVADAARLVARLRELHRDRYRLNEVRRRLESMPGRSTQEMFQDYLALLTKHPHRREPRLVAAAATWPRPKEQSDRVSGRWVHVSSEATWAQAAQEFWAYTRRKAAQSPRLPLRLRRKLGP